MKNPCVCKGFVHVFAIICIQEYILVVCIQVFRIPVYNLVVCNLVHSLAAYIQEYNPVYSLVCIRGYIQEVHNLELFLLLMGLRTCFWLEHHL